MLRKQNHGVHVDVQVDLQMYHYMGKGESLKLKKKRVITEKTKQDRTCQNKYLCNYLCQNLEGVKK